MCRAADPDPMSRFVRNSPLKCQSKRLIDTRESIVILTPVGYCLSAISGGELGCRQRYREPGAARIVSRG